MQASARANLGPRQMVTRRRTFLCSRHFNVASSHCVSIGSLDAYHSGIHVDEEERQKEQGIGTSVAMLSENEGLVPVVIG